jgi:hypothetical protein
MSNNRFWVPLTVVVAVAFIGGVLIHATIPAPSGVIYACYKTSGGTLRVIDNAVTKCNQNETQLTWNVTGPVGPIGPQGPTGPEGPVGPAGPSHAYATSGGGAVHLGFAPASTLLTLAVPAGSYIIDYHTGLNTTAAGQVGVTCGLGFSAPAALTDSETVDPGGTFFHGTTLASQDAQTFAADTTISLECSADPGGITNAVNFFLRATLVGGIN